MDEVPAVKAVPLTCYGHSRPITHINFTPLISSDDSFYLVSAAKDNISQLRNGATGDWIGSFIGHKGAVWASRISETGTHVVTGSADFTAKVWDATTGESKYTLSHDHIVRAVAFAPGHEPTLVATGGQEKKLRVWDLKANSPGGSITSGNTASTNVTSWELGAGLHTATIKSIVWNPLTDMIITAGDDKTVRWWDLRQQAPAASYIIDGPFGSLELSQQGSDATLSVASGKKAYFFDGQAPGQLLKAHDLGREVSSTAINWEHKQFVAGSSKSTWAHIHDYETGKELVVQKGHHGPVWTTAFSPDGKMYASGSEDGTIKLWKYCNEPYGMWKGAESATE